MYKADREGVREVINNPVSANNLNELLDMAPTFLNDKLLISGGHTVVNLNNRFEISHEVERSAKFCIDYIIQSVKRMNVQPDFLMEINDFYMEKSDGNEIDGANEFRKLATSPYIIPKTINDYVISCNLNNSIQINSLYVSEKNMADRFKRHIKNRVNKEKYFMLKNNDVFIKSNDIEFCVVKDNKPTCAAGNAATFRAIRYKVSSNKIFDNYKSHIGVFPLCSLENVLNGYRAATIFYEDFNLPSLLVFFGRSCFE
uniref:hypothetical protein n=1 Tax=Salmonella enterica TaxID=28901 RepID=UPI001FFA2D94|nr:hypothetical protein [Salmonella enterica]